MASRKESLEEKAIFFCISIKKKKKKLCQLLTLGSTLLVLHTHTKRIKKTCLKTMELKFLKYHYGKN